MDSVFDQVLEQGKHDFGLDVEETAGDFGFDGSAMGYLNANDNPSSGIDDGSLSPLPFLNPHADEVPGQASLSADSPTSVESEYFSASPPDQGLFFQDVMEESPEPSGVEAMVVSEMSDENQAVSKPATVVAQEEEEEEEEETMKLRKRRIVDEEEETSNQSGSDSEEEDSSSPYSFRSGTRRRRALNTRSRKRRRTTTSGSSSSTASVESESEDNDSRNASFLGSERSMTDYSILTPDPTILSELGNKVKLSRDELLRLNSEQYEEHVAKLMSERELTSKERKEVHRQRRLIKNRESAQLSRQRKKDYIEDLERKVAELAQENSQLRETTTAMRTENSRLTDEVKYLNTVVKKSGLSKIFTQGATYLSQLKSKKSDATPVSQNMKTAGVCLFVMILMVGMFVNKGSGGMENGDPFSASPPLALGTESSPHGAQRPVSGVIESGHRQPRVLREDPSFQLTASRRNALDTIADQKMTTTRRIEKTLRSRRALDDESVFNSNDTSLKKKALEPSVVRVVDDSEVQSLITKWEPNTTYLMCDRVKEVLPPVDKQHQQQAVSDAPPQISFIIPPDVMGGGDVDEENGCDSTLLDGGSDSNNRLLAVTCQIVAVKTLTSRLSPAHHFKSAAGGASIAF